MRTESITLDLDKRLIEQPPLILRHGETRALSVDALVTDRGYEIDLSRYTVSFAIVLKDSYLTGLCETEGSHATFSIPGECAENVGVTYGYLILEAEGVKATTGDFRVRVEKGKEGCPCNRFT